MMTAREAVDPRESAAGARGAFRPDRDGVPGRFRAALPAGFTGAMVDAYLFMVEALVMMMAAGDRVVRLDDERGALSPAGLADPLLERLTRFCAAGIERLLVA